MNLLFSAHSFFVSSPQFFFLRRHVQFYVFPEDLDTGRTVARFPVRTCHIYSVIHFFQCSSSILPEGSFSRLLSMSAYYLVFCIVSFSAQEISWTELQVSWDGSCFPPIYRNEYGRMEIRVSRTWRKFSLFLIGSFANAIVILLLANSAPTLFRCS